MGLGESTVRRHVGTSTDLQHIIPNAAHATSPTEHTLLDLVPLTSFPPHNIALALLTTPRGAILASVSLSATEDAPSEGTPWKAILREEASIGEIGTPLRIAISPEVEQDGIGLACLVGEDGSTLIVRPSFSGELSHCAFWIELTFRTRFVLRGTRYRNGSKASCSINCSCHQARSRLVRSGTSGIRTGQKVSI